MIEFARKSPLFCLVVALLCTCTEGSDPARAFAGDPELLKHRLEAAEEGSVFITFEPTAVTISIRNLNLKTLDLCGYDLFGKHPTKSRIAGISPDWRHPDFAAAAHWTVTADVAGQTPDVYDYTVSVSEMPSDYQITLDDGGQIWVAAVDNSQNEPTNRWIPATVIEKASEAKTSSGMLQLCMDPDVARQLYWVLRTGTTVIY